METLAGHLIPHLHATGLDMVHVRLIGDERVVGTSAFVINGSTIH